MRRRILGIIGAAVLAVAGTVALVTYVRSAEDRALAGQELAQVYIVTQPIPAGTAGGSLAPSVRLDEVPVKARVAAGVADLGALDGLVTTVDLLPGEQLSASRFVDARDQTVRSDGSLVPPGLLEVTVELSRTRAVGGAIEAGDTVGVIVTFDTPEPGSGGGTPVVGPDGEVTDVVAGGTSPGGTTHLILHKVLVTAVRGADGTAEASEDGPVAGDHLVTLAVSAADAERIVYAAEFGRLWLAAQGVDADQLGTRIQTRASIHEATVGSVG